MKTITTATGSRLSSIASRLLALGPWLLAFCSLSAHAVVWTINVGSDGDLVPATGQSLRWNGSVWEGFLGAQFNSLYVTYQIGLNDNSIVVTQGAQQWALIGLEIKSANP